MKQDEEHLRLLSIFHYVVGGLTALAACFPFIHLAAVECLFMPLGTILGVFTIIVLTRPSVKAFFQPTNL